MSFRPTVAEISRAAIRHNFSEIKKKVGSVPICAIVKADAYGHHAVLVARELSDLGVNFWGVHSVEEALALRMTGIAGRILILGGILANELGEVLNQNLTPAFHDLHNVKELLSRAKGLTSDRFPLGFHLKLDTGMGRFGIRPEGLKDVLEELSQQKFFRLEGVFAHVPCSENREYTLKQKEVFEQCTQMISAHQGKVGLRHHSNSLVCICYPELHYDLVRPGIALYGVYAHEHLRTKVNLEPVMTFVSKIIAIRDIPAGTGLSYGHTSVTRRPSRIATVPVGYADGYPRACGNQSYVLVQGCRAPVVGRVCMDMMLVDVTDLSGVNVHDRVVLFGCDLSVNEIADKVGTIPYEILCGISPRVPRILVE